MEHWKRQKRDVLGRFLSFDGTRNRKFTRHEVQKAYLDGLNARGGMWQSPSQKARAYMSRFD